MTLAGIRGVYAYTGLYAYMPVYPILAYIGAQAYTLDIALYTVYERT